MLIALVYFGLWSIGYGAIWANG